MASQKIEFTQLQIALAQSVRQATLGAGTNDKQLIETLSKYKAADLAMANLSYLQQFKKTMIADIEGDTTGHYEKTAVALCKSNAEYDAELVHNAVAGLGTNDDLLIEVLCTRNGYEVKAMAEEYARHYHKSLFEDVKDDVSGDFRKFMTTLIASPRTVMPPAAQLAKDVEILYQAGEGHWGTNEEAFIKVFATNPKQYIEQLAIEYSRKHNKVLENVLKSEFSGHLKKALIVLATPVADYFAEKLFAAMKGTGTRDNDLLRIIVSQRERHLKAITIAYMQKYKITLRDAVEKETSGDYRKLLSSVIHVAEESK